MSKKVKALLLKPVKGLGNAGDIVDVAMQYLKNVLMPQGLAEKADAQLINKVSQKHAKKAATKQSEKEGMTSLMDIMREEGLTIKMQATDADTLYGKVDAKAIAQAIKEKYAIAVNPKHIVLPEAIKELGTFSFTLSYEKNKEDIPLIIEAA